MIFGSVKISLTEKLSGDFAHHGSARKPAMKSYNADEMGMCWDRSGETNVIRIHHGGFHIAFLNTVEDGKWLVCFRRLGANHVE